MIKALVLKELREIIVYAAAALAIFLAVAIFWIGNQTFASLQPRPGEGRAPFLEDGLLILFGLLWGLFAILLGLWQSAFESPKGMYLFLLHRPMRRDTIFLTKMATGIGVYLLIGAVPIVALASWAATPGNIAGPFEWSMTGDAWCVLLMMTLVYFGAFLTGLLPGKWHTALLPLTACVLMVFLLAALVALSLKWFLWLPIFFLLAASLGANALYVGRMRNYS